MRIPVTAAVEIAKKYGQDRVIIYAINEAEEAECVTTYGNTMERCRQAAVEGNALKRALGWPEELCQAKPRGGKKDG